MEKISNDAIIQTRPTDGALRNQIVLRKIFGCLCIKDLKQCRLVNKTWDIEARSYLKDFRKSYPKISELSTCSSLYRLNGLISDINVGFINSVRITFEPENHWDCQFRDEKSVVYNELLEKLQIKHLSISWATFDGQPECPAKKFVISLLREKNSRLHTLNLLSFLKTFRAILIRAGIRIYPT